MVDQTQAKRFTFKLSWREACKAIKSDLPEFERFALGFD